jgi:hypothetical protein
MSNKRKQTSITGFTTVKSHKRKGYTKKDGTKVKPTTVKKHRREKPKPKLSKSKKEEIKKGDSKELIQQEEKPYQIIDGKYGKMVKIGDKYASGERGTGQPTLTDTPDLAYSFDSEEKAQAWVYAFVEEKEREKKQEKKNFSIDILQENGWKWFNNGLTKKISGDEYKIDITHNRVLYREKGEDNWKAMGNAQKFIEERAEVIRKEKEKNQPSKEEIDKNTQEFLKSFKDERKQMREKEQGNLDKLLGINTKLYEEYGDMKAFDKKQQRLG